MKKYIVGAVLSLGLLASPTFTQAAGLTNAQVQAILSLLSSFGVDSATIANVTVALTNSAPTTGGQSFCHNFNSDLTLGSNTDVPDLRQALSLAGFAPIYSYHNDNTDFNNNDAAGVILFQAKYNIRQTGYVGPLTRAKLNSLYGCWWNQQSPAVTVLSPNGGEVWEIGKSYDFKWRSQGEGKIIINLDNIDTGVRYGTFDAVSGIDASMGTSSWIVRNINLPVGRYRAVINGYSTGVSDSSDSYFTIVTAPTVTVLSPNGGESYNANAAQPIVSLKVQVKDFKQKGNLNLYFTTRNDLDWKFGANYLVHGATGVDNANFNPYIDSSTMGLSVPGAGPQYAPGKYYLYAEWTSVDGTIRGDFSDSYFIITSN